MGVMFVPRWRLRLFLLCLLCLLLLLGAASTSTSAVTVPGDRFFGAVRPGRRTPVSHGSGSSSLGSSSLGSSSLGSSSLGSSSFLPVATLADERQSLLARSTASTASTATSRLLDLRAGAQNNHHHHNNNNHNHNKGLSSTHVEQSLKIVLDILTTTCRVVLPPVVAVTQMVTDLYRVLPRDALLAQAGLVYCLAGGYFPTLFCAVSAAQQCGMAVVLDATTDLVEEAVRAVDAATSTTSTTSLSSWSSGDQASDSPTARQLLQQKTLIVLATIDPVKINQAVGALCATWMGVAAVLEREFARTITLSLTLAGYLRPVTRWLIAPPLYHIVPEDFHAWVPAVLDWSCKAASMSLAWRIQRVFTAASSAVAGGLLCARALLRMAARRLPWLQRRTQDGDETATYIDELLGFALAGLGLYVQIGNGFAFQVPFPLNLVTWPFEIAERWIQWQITK